MPIHTRHTYIADADAPLDRVQIDFCYWPGAPEEGPSYANGGQPAEPATVDWTEVSVEVDGVWHYDVPAWLAERIAKDHENYLFDHARSELDFVAEYRANRRAA